MRIAFLPITPLLIPEVATGAADELGAIRGAALRAVAAVCDGAEHIGILVPGTADTPLTSWALDGFGVRVGHGDPVDLPVAVAGWLLGGRHAHVVGTGAPAASLRACDAVLAMGDGSSARGEKAPGYAHPQAVGFDEQALAALGTGDPAALASLSPELGVSVGAAGTPVWRRLGALVGPVDEATVDAVDDCYGVLYVVATWHARWADPA